MRTIALLLVAAFAACGGPSAPEPSFPAGTVIEDCRDVCEGAPSTWPDARCSSGKAVDESCNAFCTPDACGLLPCACGGVLPCFRVRLVCK